jgi:hypothetical protein
MRTGLHAAALLLALGSSLASASETALRPFTASYSITWHSMSAGSSSLKLEKLPDGRWAYSSQSSAKGLFRLAMPAELSSRSVFRIVDGRILPESFTADDGASSNEKDQRITFDWAAGKVTGVAERRPVDLQTRPGLLDTLSVQVALMHEMLAGRKPERFALVDKDKIKTYNYTVEGEETVRSAIGEYRTVIFRSARPDSKNGTYFWCAPDLGYLPLKVERRDGKEVQWSMAVKRADIEARP